MGIESFYVKVYVEKNEEDIYSLLKKDFLDVFNFSFERNCVMLTGTLISFLPYCDLIFKLCLQMNQADMLIETLTNRKKFKEFNDENEFLCWMISSWGKKIDAYNIQMGSFIVTPDMYYRNRRKLKKYLKKIIL